MGMQNVMPVSDGWAKLRSAYRGYQQELQWILMWSLQETEDSLGALSVIFNRMRSSESEPLTMTTYEGDPPAMLIYSTCPHMLVHNTLPSACSVQRPTSMELFMCHT